MNKHVMKAVLAFSCVAVLACTASAVKVTPALKMDTYTDAGNKTDSFGSEKILWTTSENNKPVRIAYLSFSGMTKLPQQIRSGSLRMYAEEVERSGKISIYLYENAAMDTITWENQPEYDPGHEPGAGR